jgi:hypothetical protein
MARPKSARALARRSPSLIPADAPVAPPPAVVAQSARPKNTVLISEIPAAGGVTAAAISLRIYDDRSAGAEVLCTLKLLVEALDQSGLEVPIAGGVDSCISIARTVLRLAKASDTPRRVRLEAAAAAYREARDTDMQHARRQRDRPCPHTTPEERVRWTRYSVESARRHQHSLMLVLRSLRQEVRP